MADCELNLRLQALDLAIERLGKDAPLDTVMVEANRYVGFLRQGCAEARVAPNKATREPTEGNVAEFKPLTNGARGEPGPDLSA